ncbi:hypothetical protein E1286_27260 [Nonomuraea terrae]|uniref:Uncharacterized protein n=1 Tax=Nonomuraea terrae TaxID=2530383 RepID=A0A4R4YJD4_9ACTN|nr:hypothetical protein [Nonomuraea terrae]TDD44420.1 hypothetical protein E1286_27260 [Nonomuraea terrae]
MNPWPEVLDRIVAGDDEDLVMFLDGLSDLSRRAAAAPWSRAVTWPAGWRKSRGSRPGQVGTHGGVPGWDLVAALVSETGEPIREAAARLPADLRERVAAAYGTIAAAEPERPVAAVPTLGSRS